MWVEISSSFQSVKQYILYFLVFITQYLLQINNSTKKSLYQETICQGYIHTTINSWQFYCSPRMNSARIFFLFFPVFPYLLEVLQKDQAQ